MTVLASDLEAESEKETKMDDRRRLFRPFRWINFPFTRLSFLAEGEIAVATEASEAEEGCAPGGAVVGRVFGSGVVCRHCYLGLIWKSGGYAVICFLMPA